MSRHSKFTFSLYVAGNSPNSVLAINNLAAFCRDHLSDRYEITIIDVFRDPKRALEEGIFLTPTLIALTPSPVRRIVGTLSQLQTVLRTLDLIDQAT
jgi:circadian clock protein KaiB